MEHRHPIAFAEEHPFYTRMFHDPGLLNKEMALWESHEQRFEYWHDCLWKVLDGYQHSHLGLHSSHAFPTGSSLKGFEGGGGTGGISGVGPGTNSGGLDWLGIHPGNDQGGGIAGGGGGGKGGEGGGGGVGEPIRAGALERFADDAGAGRGGRMDGRTPPPRPPCETGRCGRSMSDERLRECEARAYHPSSSSAMRRRSSSRSRRVTFRSSPAARIRPSAESSRQLMARASASRVTSRWPVVGVPELEGSPRDGEHVRPEGHGRIAPWPVASRSGGARPTGPRGERFPPRRPRRGARHRPARRGPSRRPGPTRA